MKLRIGTRSSPLALYQANEVANKLHQIGVESEIIHVNSAGDKNLKQPLYEMNVVGLFTKNLDIALLNGTVDLAVHSLKDVPTKLPQGIILSSYLERGSAEDVLVYKSEYYENNTIATCSLRRRAFLKNKYRNLNFENLRGNVQTRLQKLINANWYGAVFAKAAIDRSDLANEIASNNLEIKTLDWMYPAPSQGIIGVVSLVQNEPLTNILHRISHQPTEYLGKLERSFLRELEGGCSMPIGISTKRIQNSCSVKAAVLTVNGLKRADLTTEIPIENPEQQGIQLAQILLKKGGKPIVEELRKEGSH